MLSICFSVPRCSLHGTGIFTKPFPLQIGPSFGLLIHTFGAFFGYNNCTFWDAVRSWMIFWKMMLEKLNPVKSHLKMAWLRVTCVYLLAHRHTGPKLSLPEFCGIFYPPYSWFAWKSWESKGPTPFNVHAYPPKKYSRPCWGIMKPTIKAGYFLGALGWVEFPWFYLNVKITSKGYLNWIDFHPLPTHTTYIWFIRNLKS